MKNRTDFITGIVLAVFALWYFFQSTTIRIFPGMGKSIVNSQTMPKVWAVCLLLLAVALMSRSFRKGVPDPDAGRPRVSLRQWISRNTEVLATFAALFVYAALLAPLGFVIATIAYIYAQTLILMPQKQRNHIKALLLGVVAAPAAYFIFVHWLNVLLPAGAIFE